MQKAIFLDRDGTINVDHGYVYQPEKLKFIDGVESSLKKLQDAGYLLIIITNQSGIGRGYFSELDAQKFNDYLINDLIKSNIKINDIYMCPHSPEEACNCRKPSPKFILDAIEKYNINPSKSYMLGDKQSDVESGINAGINAFLIDKEHNIEYWTKKILNIEI